MEIFNYRWLIALSIITTAHAMETESVNNKCTKSSWLPQIMRAQLHHSSTESNQTSPSELKNGIGITGQVDQVRVDSEIAILKKKLNKAKKLQITLLEQAQACFIKAGALALFAVALKKIEDLQSDHVLQLERHQKLLSNCSGPNYKWWKNNIEITLHSLKVENYLLLACLSKLGAAGGCAIEVGLGFKYLFDYVRAKARYNALKAELEACKNSLKQNQIDYFADLEQLFNNN